MSSLNSLIIKFIDRLQANFWDLNWHKDFYTIFSKYSKHSNYSEWFPDIEALTAFYNGKELGNECVTTRGKPSQYYWSGKLYGGLLFVWWRWFWGRGNVLAIFNRRGRFLLDRLFRCMIVMWNVRDKYERVNILLFMDVEKAYFIVDIESHYRKCWGCEDLEWFKVFKRYSQVLQELYCFS